MLNKGFGGLEGFKGVGALRAFSQGSGVSVSNHSGFKV